MASTQHGIGFRYPNKFDDFPNQFIASQQQTHNNPLLETVADFFTPGL
jgi:hypothetical protein